MSEDMLSPRLNQPDAKISESADMSQTAHQTHSDTSEPSNTYRGNESTAKARDKSAALEEGEVVLDSFRCTFQQRPRQEGSSHFLYNSYESSHFKKLRANSNYNTNFIDSQLMAQLELKHLQKSLQDKVKEFEYLTSELKEAHALILKLKEEFRFLGASETLKNVNIEEGN